MCCSGFSTRVRLGINIIACEERTVNKNYFEEEHMANRTYFVKKDGAIIKELKSLSAAKKIAMAESADVYCGDEIIAL